MRSGSIRLSRTLAGLSPALVRSYIDAQIEQVRSAGYNVTNCLIDPADTEAAETARALSSRRFDCVLIGAGLRAAPEQWLLFEKIINLVHRLAPHSAICFNSSPADSLAAVQRWIAP